MRAGVLAAFVNAATLVGLTVYIFVDEFFPKDVRSSAQGLFNVLILGLGPFAGSLLWGELADRFRTPTGDVDFERLFLVPAWLGVAATILLLVALLGIWALRMIGSRNVRLVASRATRGG